MQKLIIEDDEGKTVVVPLIRDEITVGRQEGNTVRLTEQNISRRHARLRRENGVLSVEDLGSYNGITVNGLRIKQKQALKDGDEIAIGDYKFGFKAEKSAEKAADRTLGYEAAVPFAKPAPAAAPAAPPPPAEPAQEHAAAPPPDEEIDGSPTIPVRTLADQERDQPGAALVGKLVVVSSALQGHEFLLDKPSLVVGRTPENDVVLNHKSISRHHAKIIRDGAHFVIVDLESANGVRVNGNSEERSQLDHGDTIELGHVRMRFLAGANADSAAALAEFRTSRKPMLIGGVAVATVAVVLVFALSGGKGGESGGQPAATAAAPIAPIAPPPAAKPPEKTADEWLAEAKQASAAGRWDDALESLRKAATLAPASAEVSTLAAQVQAERTGAEKLTIVKTEVAAGNFAAARVAAGEIPDASSAKAVAGDLVTQGQADFIAAHLRTADEHRAAGACDDAKAEVALVTAIEPGNPAAKEVIALCKPARRAAVASSRRSEPKPAPAPRRPVAAAAAPRPDPEPATAAPEPAAEGDPDEFIRKAQDAWLKGQYAAAIDSSRGALRLRPGMQRAYQIIAVCSCSLRDESAASKAYEKLDGKSRDLVKSLCQKNGIALD